MTVTRLVARPLLASVFISGGIDTLRNPAPRAKLAEPVTSAIADIAPSLPDDGETLVKINAAVQLGAGSLLALGKFPRLSAALLAGSLVPTTLAGHRFWEESDPATRKQQQTHFFKNTALLGALILAAFDTEGAPSLTWRAKRLTARAGSAASAKAGKHSGAAHDTAASVRDGASAARDLASHGAVAALGAAGAIASAARDAGVPAVKHTAAAARDTGLPAARNAMVRARDTGVPAARHAVTVARETGVPAAKQAATVIRELPVRHAVEQLAEAAREAMPA
jgi:uncharacterized membrane protein YphA (DoxX/SURF4 family)